ncbi:hypothetical protein GIW81_16240 [Hyphomicrobium sp. xq]|uniref:Uncharacterized protein n=1 Tax=Hyphomicrobium album TaxID=2665159 RepID=A0A6I3KN45_9HYPH|nr:hypothetical protein [Hyphomicrobium album]MTD95889.1 hypothetical protein [Hyphomicrobium album]
MLDPFTAAMGAMATITAATMTIIGTHLLAKRRVVYEQRVKEKALADFASNSVVAKKAAGSGEFNPKTMLGQWRYEVSSNDDTGYRHFGECTLSMQGERVRFDGTRTCTVVQGQSQKLEAHWESDWAQACVDGKLRAEYTIYLSEKVVGYFILSYFADDAQQMRGKYFTLAPKLMYGTIRYYR